MWRASVVGNIDKQIILLQQRIRYLRNFRKMLDRDASFKEVVDLIVTNEAVSDSAAFLQSLTELIKDQADDTLIEGLVNA